MNEERALDLYAVQHYLDDEGGAAEDENALTSSDLYTAVPSLASGDLFTVRYLGAGSFSMAWEVKSRRGRRSSSTSVYDEYDDDDDGHRWCLKMSYGGRKGREHLSREISMIEKLSPHPAVPVLHSEALLRTSDIIGLAGVGVRGMPLRGMGGETRRLWKRQQEERREGSTL